MARKRTTGFAARVRELRAAAGLTQAQLAERAGMHLHGLTKLEQGDREPAWSSVLDLARALGVDVGAFVAEQDLEAPRAGAADSGKAPPARAKRVRAPDVPPAQVKPPRRKPPRPRGG
jgi:transcriptional regulator with XRE-family HTH domain